MMIFGQNVAAFKVPHKYDFRKITEECLLLEDCMLPHNMHLSNTNWLGAPLRSPLGDYTLTDSSFFRYHPEMQSVGDANSLQKRKEYMSKWQWTELCHFAPYTTEVLMSIKNYGAFLNAARFLKILASSEIAWHSDNTPGKEFRLTFGLKGIQHEIWEIETGFGTEIIPMQEGELWFVDIALRHRVRNRSNTPRYRLALQYYAPISEALLSLYSESSESDIIFSKQYDFRPPFREF